MIGDLHEERLIFACIVAGLGFLQEHDKYSSRPSEEGPEASEPAGSDTLLGDGLIMDRVVSHRLFQFQLTGEATFQELKIECGILDLKWAFLSFYRYLV